MSDKKPGNPAAIRHPGLARIIMNCMGIFFLMQIILPVSLKAQGDLLITPRRVVFDGSKRSVDLNLANIGKDSATYAVSLIQMRMKEDGGFETITEPDPDQRFADRYVRFFPRTVTLAPNESQVIKIQLQRNNELTDGEYRSHLYFRSVPRLDPLGTEQVRADTSNGQLPPYRVSNPTRSPASASVTSTELALCVWSRRNTPDTTRHRAWCSPRGCRT